jgi:signal transduction histidine kinase
VKRIDLRLKLMTGIALVCLSIIFLLGSTLYVASEQMEEALVEQLISEEMEFLVQRYFENSDYKPSQRPNVEYYILADSTLSSTLPAEVETLDQGHHELFIDSVGGQRDIFIRDEQQTRFLVIYDIGTYEDRETAFKQLIIFSVLAAIVFAIFLGYLLSGYLTKQLSLLTQQVENLNPDNPYESLIKPKQEKEVAILAAAFDKYHRLFLGMITREKDFTTNVAHEIRTPLTSIRTSCELLAATKNLDAKSIDRLNFIMLSVDSMDEHAEALLFLARRQELRANNDIYLKECVEDCLSHYKTEIYNRGLATEVSIESSVALRINRQALLLVLNNLIKNSITYTEQGSIRIAFAQNRLTVKDTGCGIESEQLAMIFQRQYRVHNNKPGMGLGLDIVNRVCEHCGWKIDVSSAPDKGTTFIIDFA